MGGIFCGRISKHGSYILPHIFERAFRNFHRAMMPYANLHRASTSNTSKPCCLFFCTEMVHWLRTIEACIYRIPMRIKGRSICAVGTTA